MHTATPRTRRRTGNINAAVANNQLGAGKNIFVGGGVMITTGYQNIGAFLLLLRSGFATHAVGGGVLIHVGHIHVRVWGIAAVFNAGQVRIDSDARPPGRPVTMLVSV